MYTQNGSSAIVPYTDTEGQLSFIESIEDNYSHHIRDFCRWVRENGRGVDYSTLQDYFVDLNTSGYAAATVNVKRAAVKKRIRQLSDADFSIEGALKLDRVLKQLDREPGTKGRKINTPEVGLDKVISEDEYTVLLDNARSERQRAFMRFLWTTGCRISESLAIKRQDCRTEGSRVFIRLLGKGSKERFIKIPVELHNSILNTFRGTNYLFSTSSGKPYTRSYVSGQIKKLGTAFLHRSISAHSFRHSFATRKISETGKIKAVSKYLGHSSTSITLNMYVHETLSDDELFI